VSCGSGGGNSPEAQPIAGTSNHLALAKANLAMFEMRWLFDDVFHAWCGMSNKQDADSGELFDFTVVYSGRRTPKSQRRFPEAVSIPRARIIMRAPRGRVPGSPAQHRNVIEELSEQTEKTPINARSGGSQKITKENIHERRHVLSVIREMWQHINIWIRLS
jgi:hypothetical protein